MLLDIYLMEIIIPFFLMGFITWYGTGLDDLLLMATIFKNKNRSQKIEMLFGNVLAVSVMLLMAVGISAVSGRIEANNSLLRLPGIIPITIGFLEIKKLVEKDKSKKSHDFLLRKKKINLFVFSFLLYIFNSVDDLVVSVTIILSNWELVKVVSYAVGFVVGAIGSLWLASKFSKITKKIKFLEFLAPVVLIIIGILIFGGVMHR